MPRRPLTRTPGTWWERIKEMLGDWRTWTTLIYMGVQLPLGIFYFTFTVVGLAFSLALLGLPRYPLRMLRALPSAVPNIEDTPFATLPGAGVVGELIGEIPRREALRMSTPYTRRIER